MTISNVMKMAEHSLNGQETLCQKEKLLVTSVLKRLADTLKPGLVWERFNSFTNKQKLDITTPTAVEDKKHK